MIKVACIIFQCYLQYYKYIQNSAVIVIFCDCDNCCEKLLWSNAGVTHWLVLWQMQVTGVIQDSAGHVRYVLSGTWDGKLEGAPVLNTIESSKGKVMYETGETKVLWQRRYPP